MKFTKHKISHFKVYNSVAFSVFTMSYKQHLYLVLKCFHHPQIRLCPVTHHFPQPLTTNHSCFLSLWIWHSGHFMLIKSYVMISWCTCNFYKFQKCCLIASIEVVPIFFFIFLYNLFNFLKKFYWSTVALQCCVSIVQKSDRHLLNSEILVHVKNAFHRYSCYLFSR